MRLAARSLSPRCGGESEIEGLGERKPPKLQISQVGGSVHRHRIKRMLRGRLARAPQHEGCREALSCFA